MAKVIGSSFEIAEESTLKGYRDGIEIEKGIIINEQHAIDNEELYKKYCAFFTAYPDLFLDLIKPADSNFDLYFYQRIFLRACMRFRKVYVCAPRAFSKTFISILALILKCIFQPGIKLFICAPHINQSAKIATEKIKEIYDLFPFLRREVVGTGDQPGNFGKDYVKLTFKNGSLFDVVGTTDSTRGGRRHSGLIDEVRDHDETEINEIVLPLMNVNRRTKARIVNPNEPNQQTILATSAGAKQSYAKTIKFIGVFKPREPIQMGCGLLIA